MDAVSLHRRLYRLALLLTGRPERADVHARAVATDAIRRRPRSGGRPRLGPASADRLERQVLLACRRDAAGDPRAAPGFGRLEGLPGQFREAFVLVRVLGRSLREAARAMDCSRTAVRRHLERADAALLAAASTSGAAAPNVAAFVDELRHALHEAPDAPPFRLRDAIAPRRRRLRLVAGLLVGATLVLLAWRGWAAWSGRSDAPPRPDAPAAAEDRSPTELPLRDSDRP